MLNSERDHNDITDIILCHFKTLPYCVGMSFLFLRQWWATELDEMIKLCFLMPVSLFLA